MPTKLLKEWREQLILQMPAHVEKILAAQPEQKIYAIAFLTTDDFYGLYTAYETVEHWEQQRSSGKSEYYRWGPAEWAFSENGDSQVFYEALVQIIDQESTVDLTQPSEEKWAFATAFIDALGAAVSQVPESIFQKYGYGKEELLFFTTMGDGDYIVPMAVESAKRWNRRETATAFLAFFQD